jgi:hypothetical protein
MHGIVSDAPLAHFRRLLAKYIQSERQESISLKETLHA